MQPIHRWKTTGNKFKCNKFTKAVNIETKILFSHGKLHKIDAESALHNKLIKGHQCTYCSSLISQVLEHFNSSFFSSFPSFPFIFSGSKQNLKIKTILEIKKKNPTSTFKIGHLKIRQNNIPSTIKDHLQN